MHKNGNRPITLNRSVPEVGQPSAGTYVPAVSFDLDGSAPAVPLSHYLWIIRRNAEKISGFVLACIVATLIISMRVTPIYEAKATLDIDRQSPPGIIGEEASRATTNDADQFLATQAKLVQSDAVLRPVVQKYNLLQHEGVLDVGKPAEAAANSPCLNQPFLADDAFMFDKVT